MPVAASASRAMVKSAGPSISKAAEVRVASHQDDLDRAVLEGELRLLRDHRHAARQRRPVRSREIGAVEQHAARATAAAVPRASAAAWSCRTRSGRECRRSSPPAPPSTRRAAPAARRDGPPDSRRRRQRPAACEPPSVEGPPPPEPSPSRLIRVQSVSDPRSEPDAHPARNARRARGIRADPCSRRRRYCRPPPSARRGSTAGTRRADPRSRGRHST